MTEDEAKTKWCPMVRFIAVSSHLNGGAQFIHSNRNDIDTTKRYCIGSDCMMWRLSERHYLDNVPPKSPIQGYCGLAGAATCAAGVGRLEDLQEI